MTTFEITQVLHKGLSSVIKGKDTQIEIFLASFLAGGHILIEDVPGLGKTTLAKTLAQLVSSGNDTKPDSTVVFKRIQFTPDLLPYDITGVDVFNPQEHRFEFIPGPVFCEILLADEINRTTPKVQSALLEVMAEKQVTSGGITRPVNDLFFVVATQNPIDSEGTYPLPVAQLDRFMLSLSLGYPDYTSELNILHQDPTLSVLPYVTPVVNSSQIIDSREEQKSVFCHPALEQGVLSIVRATRENTAFSLGVSPRGALHLLHAARAIALIRGRSWIEDRDISDLVVPVLCHRVISKENRADVSSIIIQITQDVLRKLDKKIDWSKDYAAYVLP